MIHDLLVFLTKWSPHIWLFGSIFGVLMSGALLHQNVRYLTRADLAGVVNTPAKFWLRHALWFTLMHTGYLAIGVLAVAGIENDWSSLVTLLFLVTTPLVLVYRSYDSLRLNRRDGD